MSGIWRHHNKDGLERLMKLALHGLQHLSCTVFLHVVLCVSSFLVQHSILMISLKLDLHPRCMVLNDTVHKTKKHMW